MFHGCVCINHAAHIFLHSEFIILHIHSYSCKHVRSCCIRGSFRVDICKF